MDLGFEDIVKESFQYLEKEYGLRCVESGPYCVKYQSLDVYVSLLFDGNRSYELYCQIGRNDNYKDTGILPLDLADVVNFYLQPETLDIFCRATDRNTLLKYTNEYSKYLLKYGRELLRGSRDIFKKIVLFREDISKKYAQENESHWRKVELDRAWENKDFQKVVNLLSPFQGALNGIDSKKLEYAKKKLHLK